MRCKRSEHRIDIDMRLSRFESAMDRFIMLYSRSTLLRRDALCPRPALRPIHAHAFVSPSRFSFDRRFWGEKARVKTLIFRAFTEPASRVNAVLRGEVDLSVALPF
jgi:hypothetical protein